jgi:outer membrane protein OmpA-like peptidoglycan-associated protein
MKTGFLPGLAVAVAVAGSAPAQTTPGEGAFVIFFGLNRAAIMPDMAAILDNAAVAFLQGGHSQILLAGHADRAGSAAYNMSLSQRRTEVVRAYLAGRGVPVGAIVTDALGEQRPRVGTRDGMREPQNRRVEITFGPSPAT